LLDARQHHVDGCAEQDDRVEAAGEPPLIRPAPGDEEMTLAVPVEELRDPVLSLGCAGRCALVHDGAQALDLAQRRELA
jgi:hypothetical protein